ncbi:MAG: HlyD family type I secretion periplasmic adaptor subunit [Magnetospirillum sp.]|nr:HlyD family type I secretion periplasmic adaptor subunit [Magnetospirillum sp.]
MTSQSLAKPPTAVLPPETDAAVGQGVKRSSRQARHLALAIQLEESGTAPLVRFAMAVASAACLCFLAWASLTDVDEIAVASGQAVPSGSLVSVQHLEGGIVERVLVREGELVAEGQPLVKLSPAAALSDLDQARTREAALAAKAERLRAFADGRDPDFSGVGTGYGQIVADNLAAYQSARTAQAASRAVIAAQIAQKTTEAALLTEQAKTLKQQVAAMNEEVALRKSLLAQHLVTRVTYLDTKREQSRVQGELARVEGQAVAAHQALAEAERRLSEQDAAARKQAEDDLGATAAELAQVRESIGRLKDRATRLLVTAPARGYVKGLAVHNAGAVIQPGGLVCEIVPVDRELMIEAKVNTRDVGHLKAGQRVKVKVATWDFARYGAVMGTLRRVSASTFLDEKGEPYFKAMIALDHDYVGTEPGRHAITPGMTVEADIVTGNKTLLQYLLKPIFTQMHQSFHER